MVEQGHCADLEQAFSRYLGAGKVGDIKAFWPELDEVVQWITDAGGLAVIAHPLKYRFTRNKLRRLIGDFQQAGGTAMEVFSGRQTRQDTESLLSLACSAGLEVSVGSDFHRDMEYGPRIGVDAGFAMGQATVWQRLEQRSKVV